MIKNEFHLALSFFENRFLFQRQGCLFTKFALPLISSSDAYNSLLIELNLTSQLSYQLEHQDSSLAPPEKPSQQQ